MSSTLLTEPPASRNASIVDQAHAVRPSILNSAPVFMVGAERSGTTLLRLMLDHHPRIAFQYESEYMVEYVGDDGKLPDPQTVVAGLTTDRIFQSTGFSSDVSGGYVRMANDWLEQKRSRDDKPIVGATIHKHFDRIPHVWPNARYIHLIRDGRDVARSCVQMGWYGNAYAATDNWLEALECWDRLCRVVPEDRRMEVRYERLITEPREALTAICEFLGVDFDEAIFDYTGRSTYSYPDPKLINQWINKMPSAELAQVEGKIGSQLKARGYKLSGQPTVHLNPSQVKRLYRQSDTGRRLFRAKRFGWRLILAETLGRRLNIRALQEWARVRMNVIEERHLK